MKHKDILISFQKDPLSGILCVSKHSEKNPPPCLIICHGAFEYKENFLPLCQYLCEQGISALVLDMPGHGSSPGKRFHINIDLWVQAISSAIDFLEQQEGIDNNRIGAFGFSSGGTAVLEAAILEPRLKALITLDATVRNYLNLWDTITFKCLTGIGKIKSRFTGHGLRLKIVHVLKNAHVAFDPEINQAIISDPKMIAAYSSFPLPGAAPCAFVDTISRIHQIVVPTLVIHGEEDKIDPPKTAQMIFDSLTCEKELVFLPQSGHCGHMDTQKDKMMALTADWALKHL